MHCIIHWVKAANGLNSCPNMRKTPYNTNESGKHTTNQPTKTTTTTTNASACLNSSNCEFTTARIGLNELSILSCKPFVRIVLHYVSYECVAYAQRSRLHSVIKQYQWTVSHWTRNKSRVFFSPINIAFGAQYQKRSFIRTFGLVLIFQMNLLWHFFFF